MLNLVRALRKPENVSSVLLSRSVDGALVNVYDAALNMELFSIPQMVVLRTVETSKSYGIVLSSELSTSADFFNSAIKANATVIALAFQKYMPALQVSILHAFIRYLYNIHNRLKFSNLDSNT